MTYKFLTIGHVHYRVRSDGVVAMRRRFDINYHWLADQDGKAAMKARAAAEEVEAR